MQTKEVRSFLSLVEEPEIKILNPRKWYGARHTVWMRYNDRLISVRQPVKYCGLRFKYVATNFVVKFEDEEKQCAREAKLWIEIDPRDRKFFAPIIRWNRKEGYILQPRIRFSKQRPTKEQRKQVEKLADKYHLTDISTTSDLWNWRLRWDGRPVIFDYSG